MDSGILTKITYWTVDFPSFPLNQYLGSEQARRWDQEPPEMSPDLSPWRQHPTSPRSFSSLWPGVPLSVCCGWHHRCGGDRTWLPLSWPTPGLGSRSADCREGQAGEKARRRHLRASRPWHVHSWGDLYLQAVSQKQILSPAVQSRRWLVPSAGALCALPACPGATIVPAQRPRAPPDSDLSEPGKPHACQPSAPRPG